MKLVTNRFLNRFKSTVGSGGPRTPSGRRLNWRRDLPDIRDIRFASRLKEDHEVVLPPSVDLRSNMPAVVDQGAIGSCTGNALAGALEYLQMRELGVAGRQNHEFTASSFHHVSRLFIYWNERELEGTINEDAGATLRSGIKSLVQYGACRESTWEYQQANLFRRPNTKAFEEADPFKISEYLALHSLSEMKVCLAEGYPFSFGFMVYDNFEASVQTNVGTMDMPQGRAQGGHAVLAVGYEDPRQAFIVRNSWGTQWGVGGYFYMPYSYISNPDLAADFWRISV